MASSPMSRPLDQLDFDPAHPFKDVVICCTSVSPNIKARIATQTVELGGIHKYDLTPDCTHLIVGEYDTPKYRHVAKERPDVKPMAAGWVTAVRNVWVQDADMDFAALEKEWQLQTFETNGGELYDDGTVSERGRLLCCVTGFDDPAVRQEISDLVQAHGGIYTGDLTRRVTHLITYKPEGRKYQAAKNWGVQTVSIEWVRDSVERGMILDEKYYDPVLSEKERGKGSWNKERALRAANSGKRLRDSTAAQEEGRKKLRRSTSMKLNSQRDNLWGDILGKPPASEPPAAPALDTPAPPPAPVHIDTQGSKISSFGLPDDGSIFASCCFYLHGFTKKQMGVLVNAVSSLGGLVCHSLDEVVSASGAQMTHRFLTVPQNSKPETHPLLPENIHIITEFYIEKCMDKKCLIDPTHHVVGRPFPAFPIPGFEEISICTSGFAGLDLNQLDKSVQQLGAVYQERFTPEVSVLVCKSLSAARKEKVEFALKWKVPVVSVDWLWECICTGFNVPIREFLFPELKQKVDAPKQAAAAKENEAGNDKARSKAKEAYDKDLLPKPIASNNKSKRREQLDESAFAPEKSKPSQSFSRSRADPTADATASNFTTFESALTHQHVFTTADEGPDSYKAASSSSSSTKTPLSETSPNDLNQAPPQRKSLTRIRSEVADSEQEEDDHDMDDAPPPPAPVSPESPETIAKRLEAEKAARIAAERQAISNKLASLLPFDSAAATAAGSAPAALPPPVAPLSESAAAAAAVPDPIPEMDPPPPPPPPLVTSQDDGVLQHNVGATRRRQVFARAISNISTGSNTSATGKQPESSSVSKTATTASAPPAPPAQVVVSEQSPLTDVTNGGGGPPPPASTQLDYEDENTKTHKKQLMNKMLGIDEVVPAATRKNKRHQSGNNGEEGKLTIAGMGAYTSERTGRELRE
ncbi:putative S-M checkpoint control protein rad4, partial [Cladorrhinum sp. PSN259]